MRVVFLLGSLFGLILFILTYSYLEKAFDQIAELQDEIITIDKPFIKR